ncbi:MAG: NAD(P)/FAD-dependent oxidoreductase [Gammaproteobacteria bacterium]|nr:NAD(P)/FAD-dependent oxidoreductase [Gammaproteobacteria bacterium]
MRLIHTGSADLKKFDALIIGAGHNGLTCACYLAKAGLKVAMFESRAVVGGAAVTEEFHPGFRNSTASYTVSLLNPTVIRDLRLAEHGLRILERPVQNYVVLPDGDGMCAGPGLARTMSEVARYSARDAARLPDYYAMLDRAVELLRGTLLKTPPTDLHRFRDMWSAVSFGRDFRALPLTTQREIHAIFTRSAGEMLDNWFESDPIKSLFGFDAVVGNYASPYTPGSGYVLLHHAFGEVNGKSGVWGHAVGGMGAITQAMAREAERLGVHIELEAPVKRVITGNGRATGLELADGRVFEASRVVANIGPKLLFLKLVERDALPADFLAHMEGFRCGSAVFRMNVALSELPRFGNRPAGDHLASGIIIGPSLGYMDRAFADARLAGMSREPVIEMLIPSLLDDSLAPPGAHVASLFCQHFDYNLPDGRSWHDARDEAADLIIDTVTRHAPNFRASVQGRLALSPLDLEERFGLVGGDIFHGALGLDQLWAARPALGYGDYRTPVKGLYLCGSGAHPGGGVTGAPGHNAAREILRG